MAVTWKIYGIFHPHTHNLLYVGQTRRAIHERKEEHLLAIKDTLISKKIRQIKETTGAWPDFGILQDGIQDKRKAHYRELYYIYKYLSDGARLLNREDFDPSAPKAPDPGGKIPIFGQLDPQRAAKLEATLTRLTEARAHYHAMRYPSPRPADNDNRPASFAHVLRQMVGNPAFSVSREQFMDTLRLDKARKRRWRIYHYSALTGQVWEQEIEEEMGK